jgi:Polysaccharide lyase
MPPVSRLAVILLIALLSRGVASGHTLSKPDEPIPTLRDGFEEKPLAGFWLPGDYGSGLYVPGAIEFTRDHARTGAGSVRITVKEGNIPQPGSDDTPTERAELDSGHFPFLGRDVWYGFSFLIPKDFPIVDDRLVLSSCKQTDLGDPLVAQRYRNGRHTFTVRDTRHSDGKVTFSLPEIRKAKWIDMIYHVRYSSRDDGLVEIWMDGKRVVAHSGPLTDAAGKNRFYHKIGLYRDRWKEPMTAFFDNYTLGSSYAEVDPSVFKTRP